MIWMRKSLSTLYKKYTTCEITATNPFNFCWYLEISDGLVPVGIIGDAWSWAGKTELLHGVDWPPVVCWTSVAIQAAVLQGERWEGRYRKEEEKKAGGGDGAWLRRTRSIDAATAENISQGSPSTVWAAQANLHPLNSNYLKPQGFNWKPTANQNISHCPVSVYKCLFS